MKTFKKPKPKSQYGYFQKSFLNYWEDLLRKGEKIHFKKGQSIFYANHHPVGIFILEKGRIAIEASNGEKRTCEISHPGMPIIGIENIITAIPYSYSAVAQTDSVVRFISKSVFLDTIKVKIKVSSKKL